MTDSNTTSTGHKLTERQKLQLAEVEAAGKTSPTTTDSNLGGSDSNSGSAKASEPIPAGTPAGAPPRTGTTTTVPNNPPTPRT